MKREQLLEVVGKMKPGSDVVISRCLVMDKQNNVTGIVDIPIIGIAENKDEPEIRFVLSGEDINKVFKRDEIVPIPPEMISDLQDDG